MTSSSFSRETNLFPDLISFPSFSRELFNAFRKFDLLQEFLEDDKITEIMINGTENIFLEKEGKLIRSGKRFVSREKLEDVIQQIVAESP